MNAGEYLRETQITKALLEVRFEPVRVLDGDTFVARVRLDPLLPDVGPAEPHVRVAGVNAPELGTKGATDARAAVAHYLGFGREELPALVLLCFGRDKYGRLLADVRRAGYARLSDYLRASVPEVKPMSLARQLERERT